MNPWLRAVTLAALGILTAACPSTRYLTAPGTGSPRDAVETLRAAVLSKDPELLYRCLTPEFRRSWNIGGLAKFKLGWRTRKDEFDDLALVLERAEVVGESELSPGRVRVDLKAFGETVGLTFVKVPTFTVTVAIDGYSPDEFRSRSDWRRRLRVEGDRLRVDHPVDPSFGIADPSEIREVRLHVRWLLDQVDRPAP